MAGWRQHVLVGYIPSPEGSQRWLCRGAHRAERAKVTVVNTGKEGDYAHPQFATADDIDTIDDFLR